MRMGRLNKLRERIEDLIELKTPPLPIPVVIAMTPEQEAWTKAKYKGNSERVVIIVARDFSRKGVR